MSRRGRGDEPIADRCAEKQSWESGGKPRPQHKHTHRQSGDMGTETEENTGEITGGAAVATTVITSALIRCCTCINKSDLT